MGYITQTAMRDTAVDFSYPYFVTKVGFVTRKPFPIPNIKAIVDPYGILVWIALAVSVPAFSFLLRILSKIDKDGFSANFNTGRAFMQVSQMLVMQGMTMHLISSK